MSGIINHGCIHLHARSQSLRFRNEQHSELINSLPHEGILGCVDDFIADEGYHGGFPCNGALALHSAVDCLQAESRIKDILSQPLSLKRRGMARFRPTNYAVVKFE
jgi:hypothetical protein